MEDKKASVKTIIQLVVLMLLSFFTAVVVNIDTEGNFGLRTYAEIRVTFFERTLRYFVIFVLITAVLKMLRRLDLKGIRAFDIRYDKKSVIIDSVFIFICSIPYLIVFYPGVCNWDTINQLTDFFTGKDPMSYSWIPGQETVSVFLNDHHPVFDTLIYALFIGIGKGIGSLNAGMFIFSVLQVLIMSFSLGFMISYMAELEIPLIYRQLSLLFVALMPSLCLFNVTMIKDSTYSVFFILYLMLYINIVRKGFDRNILVLFTTVSVLLCLTKKTGIYLVLICNLILLLSKAVKGKRLKLLISSAVPFFIIFILMGKIIFPLADIYPGGKQEMLSTFIQQTSRVVVDHREELTDEELSVIDRIVPEEDIEDNYRYDSSDGVKNTYRFDATSDDISDFMKLWIKLLVRYPGSCIKATVGNCAGFFAPVRTVQVYTGIPSQDMVEITNPSELESPRLWVKDTYNKICSSKFPGLLYTVIYSWWIPLLSLSVCIKRRKSQNILCLVPVFVSILVLVASPYSGARYALSLIYTAPVILSIPYIKDLTEKTDPEI